MPLPRQKSALNADKQSQRAIALASRRDLPAGLRDAYSAQLCRTLTELPAVRRAKVILSYAAAEAEADLSVFHAWAKAQGKTVAFPVSFPGGVMEARVPAETEGWEIGRFGIASPRLERSELILPEALELVLVPCVAFDEACRRLGHGAGYYDRYLPRCTGAEFVAAAFEAQKLPEVTVDGHDMPMGAVVTERRVYLPGADKQT